jgi:adenylosuccinate synthase
VTEVAGVVKAYSTRVGSGPFPTEIPGDLGEKIRTWGGEFGATTGRARRCGWFDCPALRRSLQIGGITSLALMKLDVLSNLDEILVCTHYEIDGQKVDLMPFGLDLETEVKPVYQSFPGWKTDITKAKTLEDLPREAREYIAALEELTGSSMDMISVGPDRRETITRRALTASA